MLQNRVAPIRRGGNKAKVGISPTVSIIVILFLFLTLLNYSVRSQELENKLDTPVQPASESLKKLPFPILVPEIKTDPGEKIQKPEFDAKLKDIASISYVSVIEREKRKNLLPTDNDPQYDLQSQQYKRITDPVEPASQTNGEEKFHWKPAIAQSLAFLAFQHGARMFQPRTRDFLDGPFFRDWGTSVKNFGAWKDGDAFYINYIAHPLQGALTGRIFINNSDAAKKLEFENSSKYWKTQLKVLAWEAVWSAQYELGPLGEAAIGNVGIRSFDSHKLTWLDMVVTPTAGTAWVIGEDIIDKYILKNRLERRFKNKMAIRFLRFFLTPSISFANLVRFKLPWHRNNRQL